MRSKRLLTMLLSLCLLISMVSPAAAFATTVAEDSYVGAAQSTEADEAKNEASPYENGTVLSGEDSQPAGQKNLRDDPIVKSEVKTPETGKGGTWTAEEADVEPSVSLTLLKFLHVFRSCRRLLRSLRQPST